MYIKTIRKAICILMTVCAVCFCVLPSFAASATITCSVSQAQTSGVLIENQETEIIYDSGTSAAVDPYGEKLTYEWIEYGRISTGAVDGYIKGTYSFDMVYTYPTIPGWSMMGATYNVEKYDFQGLYVAPYTSSSSNTPNYTSIRLVFDDFTYYTENSPFSVCKVIIRATFRRTDPTANTPSTPRLQCVANQNSNNTSVSANPQGLGFLGVIEQAIIDALQNEVLGATGNISVSEYFDIYFWYLQDIKADTGSIKTSFESLLSRISTIIGQNSTSNEYLQFIDTGLQELESYLKNRDNTELLPYLHDIKEFVADILNMNQAQASSADAIRDKQNQMASEEAGISGGLQVDKPDVNNVDFNVLENVDSNTLQGFGSVVGLILSNSFIIKLGVIFLTCAIAGFALYGKKG